jgi:hypothetical protein
MKVIQELVAYFSIGAESCRGEQLRGLLEQNSIATDAPTNMHPDAQHHAVWPGRYVPLERRLGLNRTASTGLVTPRNNAMRRIRSGCCVHGLKVLWRQALEQDDDERQIDERSCLC